MEDSEETEPGSARDYQRVAELIRYLEAHAAEQPGLAELARHAGLSESRLQRLFTRWAGVSPKRFLQYLSKEHALAVLRDGGGILDAAWSAGLSGPGRLHDLLVHCEAVTPGEARGSVPLQVAYGYAGSPYGEALLAWSGRGVCFLAFRDPDDPGAALEALHAQWPGAEFSKDGAGARRLAQRVFGRSVTPGQPLALHLRGTNFQLKVWEALLRVPDGALTTYGDLAGAIGSPGAARAVGGAVGANPVAWLVPCHRVIRGSGAFGGYRWGAERKRAMLLREAATVDDVQSSRPRVSRSNSEPGSPGGGTGGAS